MSASVDGVVVGDPEVRSDRPRSLDEEQDGLDLLEVQRREPTRVRPGRPMDGTGKTCSPRTWSASRLVTNIFSSGQSRSSSSQRRRGRRDLLEVVQHEQQLLLPDVGDELVQLRLLAGIGDAELARDRRQYRRRVAGRGEVDEGRARAERGPTSRRRAQRQPRLADAARARQGEEADAWFGQALPDWQRAPHAPRTPTAPPAGSRMRTSIVASGRNSDGSDG